MGSEGRPLHSMSHSGLVTGRGRGPARLVSLLPSNSGIFPEQRGGAAGVQTGRAMIHHSRGTPAPSAGLCLSTVSTRDGDSPLSDE